MRIVTYSTGYVTPPNMTPWIWSVLRRELLANWLFKSRKRQKEALKGQTELYDLIYYQKPKNRRGNEAIGGNWRHYSNKKELKMFSKLREHFCIAAIIRTS